MDQRAEKKKIENNNKKRSASRYNRVLFWNIEEFIPFME